MVVRLPHISRTIPGPLWQAESGPHSLADRTLHPSIHHGDFCRHSLPPLRSYKSKVSAYISRLPMATNTGTEGLVYEPFDAPRKCNVTRKGEIEKAFPSGNMTSICSNYRADFTRKEAEKTSSYKPVEVASTNDTPFTGVTIYRKEFPTRDMRQAREMVTAGARTEDLKRNSRIVSKGTYSPPELPFHADTTYALAFRKAKDPPVGATRHCPLSEAPVSQVAITSAEQPFESHSVYRSEFVPKSSDAPQVPQNLSALSYNSGKRPPSRVQPFVEHAEHMFYLP